MLHPKWKRRPDLECAQCHNKFHASCLAHWFQTSHKHLCVVCQTDFVVAKKAPRASPSPSAAAPPAATPPPAPLYDQDELD